MLVHRIDWSVSSAVLITDGVAAIVGWAALGFTRGSVSVGAVRVYGNTRVEQHPRMANCVYRRLRQAPILLLPDWLSTAQRRTDPLAPPTDAQAAPKCERAFSAPKPGARRLFRVPMVCLSCHAAISSPSFCAKAHRRRQRLRDSEGSGCCNRGVFVLH